MNIQNWKWDNYSKAELIEYANINFFNKIEDCKGVNMYEREYDFAWAMWSEDVLWGADELEEFIERVEVCFNEVETVILFNGSYIGNLSDEEIENGEDIKLERLGYEIIAL